MNTSTYIYSQNYLVKKKKKQKEQKNIINSVILTTFAIFFLWKLFINVKNIIIMLNILKFNWYQGTENINILNYP